MRSRSFEDVQSLDHSPLEVWGGHECTVSRVGDQRLDQTVLSGHQLRDDDLDAFAGLGLKALRYPLLWERIERVRGEIDWDWTDKRLARAKALKLNIIAGLCHHGSGPGFVDLLSEGFAPGLALHAARTAARYPWITDWTPVNEPLTTARFSALYGHWHPHLRNERDFWGVVLNQIDAIRLSMHQIRRVIPQARLIQTDDLGLTYATANLQPQAAHDNERRWMGWDLLFGRVTPGHYFWKKLCGLGFEARLNEIATHPCPPNVIGINHYLTSDRFLDDRCALYPSIAPGGNGERAYVDVEAVRVLAEAPSGLSGAIDDAWARYGAPIALTEVHNACTRDEQVRWFADAWSCARKARARGVDLRAVTAWSLLGAFDWDSLLTRRRGHYEAGAFDVSSGERRPTALASYLRTLAHNGDANPFVGGVGWWRREIRFAHTPVGELTKVKRARRAGAERPILIAGASGTLGKAIARACAWRDLSCILTSRQDMSLDSKGEVAAALELHNPRAVINATGFVRVDDAETEVEACRRANTDAAVRLARVCAERGFNSVTFSSDLVFDGASKTAYYESDQTNPLNVYGESKAAAERDIEALATHALIVRTAAFFSPHDTHNFAAWVVRELREGRVIECADDAVVSPTYVPALADAVLDLVLDGEKGLWHLCNGEALSWAAFARVIAASVGLDPVNVRGRPRATLAWRARRPANSALGSSRGRVMGDLREAVWRFAHASDPHPLHL